MVEKLREAKIGVQCGEEQVPALLFADDMVILAEREDELRRGSSWVHTSQVLWLADVKTH